MSNLSLLKSLTSSAAVCVPTSAIISRSSRSVKTSLSSLRFVSKSEIPDTKGDAVRASPCLILSSQVIIKRSLQRFPPV